jgi:diguanylate cyclase (GGDEF)-like protein
VRLSRLTLALIGGGLAVCARAHSDDRRRIRRLRDEARRLGELARTDPLTGLPNRRAFDERFASEVARARRYGHRLALALMDLDHFKRVNDDYGHTAGDELLREAALRLQGSVRAGEVVARFGGDEFAWLLPEADVGAAELAADRVRRTLSERPVGPLIRATLSVGVACLEQSGDGPALLRRADGALMAAKAAGRDRVLRATTA